MLRGWTDWPEGLRAPVDYVMTSGGKRVRPVLALMAAEAAGGNAARALPWALAVECVHTYSLVHDDLPCMDDDDFRRGKATCHKAFDEARAVLAGDVLVTESFGILARADWPPSLTVRLMALLARASGGAGMVGGQVLDIAGNDLVDANAVERVHARKTGALFRAAIEGGAIAGGAGDWDLAAFSQYAIAIGLLFQLTDDVLDHGQDEGDAGQSVLHHLDVEAVRDRIAATANEARAAISAIGTRGEPLASVAEFIANRTH